MRCRREGSGHCGGESGKQHTVEVQPDDSPPSRAASAFIQRTTIAAPFTAVKTMNEKAPSAGTRTNRASTKMSTAVKATTAFLRNSV